jgi:hypothetical protein
LAKDEVDISFFKLVSQGTLTSENYEVYDIFGNGKIWTHKIIDTWNNYFSKDDTQRMLI